LADKGIRYLSEAVKFNTVKIVNLNSQNRKI